MSKYIIGIDLGTTNISVAYLDTSIESSTPQIFEIPQLVELGEVARQKTLPAFIYLSNSHSQGMLDVPWEKGRNYAIGKYARSKASLSADNVISSSKSWLCMANVDRESPILPWTAKDENQKISPVDSAVLYLKHISSACDNSSIALTEKELFQNQKIILTVPASFDASARDMTVLAAEKSGLQITLLEEPLAAFYAWLNSSNIKWREKVSAGERILVCDIGGGTTDFSLIEALDKNGNLELERVAVGEHILLGGDNMDLSLAYMSAAKLQRERGIKLKPYQINTLVHACREAKEILCSEENTESVKLLIPGRGSSLIGGSLSTLLTSDDIKTSFLDGFFPFCELDAVPVKKTSSGLKVFGLDYASDPAITKHLAYFLKRHCINPETANIKLPSAVLFNGGVTKAKNIRQRILELLQNWNPSEKISPKELDGGNHDFAVSLGSTSYGEVISGKSIRVRSGSPRTYYIAIESSMPAIPGFTPPIDALCVVPFGMEEGTELIIPYSGLGVLVGEKTQFKFFASTQRKDDKEGTVIKGIDAETLEDLPVLVSSLDLNGGDFLPGTLVPVVLKSVLTTTGTLELWCIEEKTSKQWKLSYELRKVN